MPSFIRLSWLVCFGAWLYLSTALATDESPLTPHQMRCAEQGPVRVCRATSQGAVAMLTIDYIGVLSHFEPVSVWVSLNGRTHTYKMEKIGSRATLFLTNGDISCIPCSIEPDPDSISCPSPALSNRWLCTQAPTEIRDLFFWAVNNRGQLNVWDLELAFVSGNDWDSRYGTNYRFRLP